MKELILWFLRTYQKVNTSLIALRMPLLGWSGCRSWPTCSEHMIESVHQLGPRRGLLKGFQRIMHCHPFRA